MDVQRSKKKGRANYFVVIPIIAPAVRAALREVQTHLEQLYPTARSELRKGFTNMDSAEVHVTLFAIHANQQRLTQVTRALANFEKEREKDLGFDLELKGLGSWTSKAGNIILYADLSRDSASHVRTLAKDVRDFVFSSITAEEEAKTKEEEEQSKKTKEAVAGSNADNSAKQDGIVTVPSAALVEATKIGNEKGGEEGDENEEEEDEEDEGEDEDEEDEEEEEDEEDDEDEDEEGEDEEDLDPEEDFPGLWFDDPRPDIYMPHVTILNSDPAWDRKLRMQLADKKEARGAKLAKAMKRGGGKARAAAEPFGHDYALFRNLRNTYNKFSFGTQPVAFLELQSEFVCIHKIPLR